jgi:hypothetical protein
MTWEIHMQSAALRSVANRPAANRLVRNPMRLAEQHRVLDAELQELERRAYLTPAEQDRTRVLKRLKLRAKDRLYANAK